MKVPKLPSRFRHLAAVAMLLCGSGCGAQQDAPNVSAAIAKVSNPQLARDLESATAGSVADRCAALKSLGDYWAPKRRRSAGFSDLPVKVPPVGSDPLPADELAAIATVLQLGVADSDHQVRESAAICLCRAPRPSPELNTAVTAALKSTDRSVLWYLSQLDPEEFPRPDPGPAVANLIEHLKSAESSSRYAAAELIESFGKRFIPHSAKLVDALPEIRKDKWHALLALVGTGLSEEAADRLPSRVENDDAETQALAFVALLPFPDKAIRFLHNHNGLGPALTEYDAYWCEILYSSAPEQQKLRAALIALPDLSPLNLALIGSADAIPLLTRELKKSNNHERPRLLACIRACGGEIGEVVHISQDSPVSSFRPKSAWPEVDTRRQSDALGHGDGSAEILVTGELRFADGGHPAKVQFMQTNDIMLMGESINEPLPLKYDAATGRFVLRTSVFAAYDVGTPPEAGPYQTGSAQVRIETSGAIPLVTQFFDEMPHVVIELRRQ